MNASFTWYFVFIETKSVTAMVNVELGTLYNSSTYELEYFSSVLVGSVIDRLSTHTLTENGVRGTVRMRGTVNRYHVLYNSVKLK